MENLILIDERIILGKNFRIYNDVENPLFLAKDIAEWINHKDVSTMIRTIDDDEKVKILTPQTMSGGLQANTEYNFLTEYGLYEVLMQSRKSIAKQFKKKVKELLKALRTGKFQAMMDERIAECVKKATEQLKLKISEKIQILTQQGLENHRPSHKTKLDWNRVIKTCAICRQDEEILKQFVLVEFDAEKWEDIPYYRNYEVLQYIRYLAEKLNMFTQVSMFDSQDIY